MNPNLSFGASPNNIILISIRVLWMSEGNYHTFLGIIFFRKTIKYSGWKSEFRVKRSGLLSWLSSVSLSKSPDNAKPQFHSTPKFYNSMVKHPLVIPLFLQHRHFSRLPTVAVIFRIAWQEQNSSPLLGKFLIPSLSPSGLNGSWQVFRNPIPQAINMSHP